MNNALKKIERQLRSLWDAVRPLPPVDVAALREARSGYGPWPKSEREFRRIMRALAIEANSYDTAAERLTLAAVTAFNYMSHRQGVTGFQASWAGMQFLKMTRGLKGPFAIVDGSKLMYPQYDLRTQLEEWLTEWRSWAADEAKKKLDAEKDREYKAHPDVVAHWERLVSEAPESVA